MHAYKAPHHEAAQRAAYYRRHASTCAAAALSTATKEIKQAYLELEQGWLCLAPKVDVGIDQTDTDQGSPGGNREGSAPARLSDVPQ
jgi:hypothetical protein